MKAGFYSPLPPVRTGVADYSAALLAALRRHGEVRVDAPRADVFLYHLGNNQIHRDIYQCALAKPGVVVLHDAVLNHFFLGSMTEGEYVGEFTYNYGEWHRDLAGELWRGRGSSAGSSRYYRYPMLKRITEVSSAVVVHNPAAAELVRRHCPFASVVEIPHLFRMPELPSSGTVVRFRQRLGIPAGVFVFGVFGYLRESKRLLSILAAFGKVRRDHHKIVLLIAGDFASSDLARAAAPLLAQAGVVRLGYLPKGQFWLAASAVDACINLRYPPAGETSGITIRMMGMGKPVLLTTGTENSRFPDTACFRIDPGIAETAALSDHMILVSSFPQLAREVGLRAADHISRHHGVDKIAKQYWDVLCANRG